MTGHFPRFGTGTYRSLLLHPRNFDRNKIDRRLLVGLIIHECSRLKIYSGVKNVNTARSNLHTKLNHV